MRIQLLTCVVLGLLVSASAIAGLTRAPEPVFTGVIKKSSTLQQALLAAGLTGAEAHVMINAARARYDLRRLRAGLRFELQRELAPISVARSLQLELSPVQSLEVKRAETGKWVAELVTREVDLQVASYSGQVISSLWDSALSAQMDPEIIVELAEIFAWQVDFAREVRVGDEWRLTVEKKLLDGKTIGWGRILAAEYRNAGQLYSAALFRRNGEALGYYAPDGSSLRKMFLKSPLRYGRISSGFSARRFHPILGRGRAHQGVDYAAPTGTPVRAVGDGTVVFASYRGGGGNVIKIRHNSTYQTAYLHLSGYAKGIRPGRKVRQGENIGYVGSTGLSTGPHLHFEFLENGRHRNPLGKKFPSAPGLPRELHAEFQQVRAEFQQALPPWSRPGISRMGASIRTVSAVADEG